MELYCLFEGNIIINNLNIIKKNQPKKKIATAKFTVSEYPRTQLCRHTAMAI